MILSIVSIAVGGLALLAFAVTTDGSNSFAGVLGAGLFLAQGILALVYIKQNSKKVV